MLQPACSPQVRGRSVCPILWVCFAARSCADEAALSRQPRRGLKSHGRTFRVARLGAWLILALRTEPDPRASGRSNTSATQGPMIPARWVTRRCHAHWPDALAPGAAHAGLADLRRPNAAGDLLNADARLAANFGTDRGHRSAVRRQRPKRPRLHPGPSGGLGFRSDCFLGGRIGLDANSSLRDASATVWVGIRPCSDCGGLRSHSGYRLPGRFLSPWKPV